MLLLTLMVPTIRGQWGHHCFHVPKEKHAATNTPAAEGGGVTTAFASNCFEEGVL